MFLHFHLILNRELIKLYIHYKSKFINCDANMRGKLKRKIRKIIIIKKRWKYNWKLRVLLFVYLWHFFCRIRKKKNKVSYEIMNWWMTYNRRKVFFSSFLKLLFHLKYFPFSFQFAINQTAHLKVFLNINWFYIFISR